MDTYYLGQNVAAIISLPRSEYGYKSPKYNDFTNELNLLKFKYITCVTADLFQQGAIKTLIKNGFQKVITFESAHDEKDETCSFWVKKNKKFKLIQDAPEKVDVFNCTVAYNNIDEDKIFNYLVTKKAPEGFTRVGKTPIYYYIEKGKVVQGIFD